MGLFDRIRKKKNETRALINGWYKEDYSYFVWNYANNISSIPEVRQAIEKISKTFGSMPIYHSRTDKSGAKVYLNDNINKVLNIKSNPMQNGSQFIEETVNKLMLNNNVFVEPVYDNMTGNLISLFALPTMVYEFNLSDDARNAYVSFKDGFGNYYKKYNMRNLIYLNRFSSLMGGAKNDLGLYETVLKSLGEKIVNDADPNKPRAILQSTVTGMSGLKPDDVKGAMKTVQAQFDEKVHGISYIDKGWSITPINWNENEVNKNLMQFIIDLVYSYFGINENIVKDKASEIEMAMFVRNTIQPLAMQFEKEFSSKLFTQNELDFGHRIEFDYNSLLVTTAQQRANLIQTLLRNGVWNIDEARELTGYPPLANGHGQVYRTSADLVNVEVVDKYQLGKVGNTQVEEKKSTEPEKVSATENVEDIKIKKEEGSNGTEN